MQKVLLCLLSVISCLDLIVADEWINSVTHTFYGWPDNGNSNAIAYDCGRGYTAQGSGTYDDPLTFATADGEFDQCEIIYDPFLGKYLRHEDLCEACGDDWEQGIWHIDVWDMSWQNGGDDEVACENAMTLAVQSRSIIRYPDSDLPDYGKIVLVCVRNEVRTLTKA